MDGILKACDDVCEKKRIHDRGMKWRKFQEKKINTCRCVRTALRRIRGGVKFEN